MATKYGRNITTVTSDLVYGVSLTNATVNASNTGNFNGKYQLRVDHQGVGCGSSGFYLELNDNVPWSNITFEVYLVGTCSCWSFCTGGYAPASGNILSYNEGNGDLISRAFNSWELSQFQTHNRESACDNDSNNFFHSSFSVGDPKRFFMRRRRNVNGSRAGIALGRACIGSVGYSIVQNIVIW